MLLGVIYNRDLLKKKYLITILSLLVQIIKKVNIKTQLLDLFANLS
jgi:hypothetical protein